ncbi:MAG: hypothetical protein CBD47_03140 [Synechococcus sp. TMED187]|uniref:hypothetical protein n=1 Tax=Synechococcus sp. MIT S9451 TaxID=3082543 RepID=UPI000B713048|nr:hypothetical protein [Synechococcus sp. NAT40]OUW48282.1 MAG: hypothetical protein CBD47_03140 [Synechococcus sp. TMED187]RZO13681.1 MAG: hypothetical protein EVB08_04785 [Synechococcus sp. MED-G135]
MQRYVVLEHTGAPDDPLGCHLDLLMEDGESCRSWRLNHLPQLDGPDLEATPLPPHRLVWLERESAAVSGGRGWARRLVGGVYKGALPGTPGDAVIVQLTGMAAVGLPDPVQLLISNGHCRLSRCT